MTAAGSQRCLVPAMHPQRQVGKLLLVLAQAPLPAACRTPPVRYAPLPARVFNAARWLRHQALGRLWPRSIASP
eukprot:symbB.v1.2.034392.t1/scaffold4430.1/size39757/2